MMYFNSVGISSIDRMVWVFRYETEESRVSQSNEDVGCAVLGLPASPAFTPSQR